MNRLQNNLKEDFIVATAFLAVFLLPLISEARSGCCSHHDGVCGCRCCDGTSLSATCAPYYPSCNSAPTPTPTPIAQPEAPATTETPKAPTAPSNSTSSKQINTTNNFTSSTNNDTGDNGGESVLGGLALLGLIGGGAWYLNKKKK